VLKSSSGVRVVKHHLLSRLPDAPINLVIRVTRLNGSVFYINAEMIEFVEGTPDTVITLTDGAKLVVREATDLVIRAIMIYRQQTHQSPWDLAGG